MATYGEVFKAIAADSHDFFFTGPAGCGKSYLLKGLASSAPYGTFEILAPTGVAALNCGGETIHRRFYLPPITTGLHANLSPFVLDTLAGIKYIFIDEISMVHSKLFETLIEILEAAAKRFRQPRPKLIMFGDIFQLAPVVEQAQPRGPVFAFESAAWKQRLNIKTIELSSNMRQSKDQDFFDFLCRVRKGSTLMSNQRRLHEELLDRFRGERIEGGIDLTCTRYYSNNKNSKRLRELPGEARVFEASGSYDTALPAPRRLELKAGCPVMFTRNDPDGRWVNGTLGEVAYLGADNKKIMVNLDNGETVSVLPVAWEGMYRKCEYIQFPLQPAFASTIHKAQGLTLPRVNLFLESAFDLGLLYVGLTRVAEAAHLSVQISSQKSLFQSRGSLLVQYEDLINWTWPQFLGNIGLQ